MLAGMEGAMGDALAELKKEVEELREERDYLEGEVRRVEDEIDRLHKASEVQSMDPFLILKDCMAAYRTTMTSPTELRAEALANFLSDVTSYFGPDTIRRAIEMYGGPDDQ